MNTTEVKNTYRFGIVVRRNHRTIGVCNCGQYILSEDNHTFTFQCEKCGNEHFVTCVNRDDGERFTVPVIDVHRSDNRGFKITRGNTSIRLKKDYDDISFEIIKDNLKRTLEYDMVDKYLKVYRNDEIEYEWNKNGYMQHLNRNIRVVNSLFFRDISEQELVNLVGNPITTPLYKSCIKYGYQKTPYLEELVVLAQHSYLQILANAGIPEANRFKDAGVYYRHNNATINADKTKPHEILGVPKYMMEYIRKDTSINLHSLRDLRRALDKVEGNKFKELLSIAQDEASIKTLINNIDRIMTLHNDYGYTNLKKLILYLFRETKMYQGMTAQTASQYLLDYNRINTEMGLEVDDKYPRSLKREHDVASMNYQVQMSKQKKELFDKAVSNKEYQDLEYRKNEKYIMVVPKEADELIREGNELSHCVGSYVNQVIEGKCKILFLRYAKDPETPVATIEVRGVNIRQARGRHNKVISQGAKDFLKEWAGKKGLHESYYY